MSSDSNTETSIFSTFSMRVVRYFMLAAARELFGSSDYERLYIKLMGKKPPMWHKDGQSGIKRHRTHHCKVTSTGSNVTIDYDSSVNRARYGNLQSCSSVWSCPICSNVIHRERRSNLMDIVRLMEKTHYVVLITLTAQHTKNDHLKQLYDGIRGSLSTMRSGGEWGRIRKELGYEFDITSFECTCGYRNGYHPHPHILAFLRHDVVDNLDYRNSIINSEFKVEIVPKVFSQIGLASYLLNDWVEKNWIKSLQKHGRFADTEHGVDVTISDRRIAEYIAKHDHMPRSWGAEDEMTRSNSKVGRSYLKNEHFTPMELLKLYGERAENSDFTDLTGQKLWSWAGECFIEFSIVFKGKRQLRFNLKLKDYLKEHGIEILEDDEIVNGDADEALYQVFFNLTMDQWRKILSNKMRGLVLDYVEFVHGNAVLVRQFLVDFGVLEADEVLKDTLVEGTRKQRADYLDQQSYTHMNDEQKTIFDARQKRLDGYQEAVNQYRAERKKAVAELVNV